MNERAYDADAIDLTNCDREPIHLLGEIQDFGICLALSSDWIITRVSANVEAYCGKTVDDLLGTSLVDVAGPGIIHVIRGRAQMLSSPDAVERCFNVQLFRGGPFFDLAIYRAGNVSGLMIDAQPSIQNGSDYQTAVRQLIERIRNTGSVDHLVRQAVRHMRGLTEFDRVMVYGFLPDGSGEVLAESTHPEAESFLGLRYPASDIPQQARALYKRNLIRIISDVDSTPVKMLPELDPQKLPVDLSMSSLRAVSRIHVEYLKNMGVRASLSISIIRRGELWGLFSCHHNEPKVLSYEQRTAVELYGQLFSFVLEQVTLNEEVALLDRARDLHDRLLTQLAADGRTSLSDIEPMAEMLRDVMRFDGVCSFVDGEYSHSGSVPTEEEFQGLRRTLNRAAAGQVLATDCIADIHPPAADWVERAAGLLAIPISRRPRDYLVLFRRELARSVTWAGNPNKPVAAAGKNGARLQPRKSFEAWRAVMRGHSEPWLPGEIRAAGQLRTTLLEIVIKISDAAAEDRQRAEQRQQILIAELNHRVRNILALIRGLVNQTGAQATSIQEFTQTIGGRVHALARAHDLITRENWNPGSMRTLIETEASAYVGPKRRDAVRIIGPEVTVQPEAFSAIALVIHELVTNSVKYGALSDTRGRVEVTLAETDMGELKIGWREMDGPAVRPPRRRGFGSSIIEKTVPYELQGSAEVRFELSGVRAEFILPAHQIGAFSEVKRMDESHGARIEIDDRPLRGKTLLIVEDNMMIALEAETLLADAGAEPIDVASTAAAALRVIEKRPPDAAILDINLGQSTSAEVAERLTDLSIPFVFASGYAEATSLTERFGDVPVVVKPYDRDTLIRKLVQWIKKSSA